MVSTKIIPNKEEVLLEALSFKFGGMLKEELGCLYDVCIDKEVLELGSMVGMSSYVIASVCKKLSCVDVWSDNQKHLAHDSHQAGVYLSYVPELPNMFQEFNKNCNKFIKNGTISIYRGNTIEMADNFYNESFDVLLIDADHSFFGVSNDFRLYNEKLRKDGLMIFHDYGDSMWTAIKEFCSKMVGENKIRFISNTYRIGIFKKV